MPTNPYETRRRGVTSKSLIVDLLSTITSPYSVGVSALVRAGGLFGLGENSMRVAIARLRAGGTVESAGRGLYRLSRAALAVNREVVSWSRVEEKVVDWDGSYLAVDTTALPARDRRARRVRDRTFRFLGFEPLTPALHVRPNNLRGGASACRERFASLALAGAKDASTRAVAPLVFELRDLDRETEDRARALWNVEALEDGYRETTGQLEAAIARMPDLSRDAAMTESFSIGGEALRQIALDPLLPRAIVDCDARHQMIEAMRRYDGLGRRAWRDWAGESVELLASPIDASGLDAAAGSA
ncbi:MAG: PaaX family transcriptional regulator [Myxococcota bacterium]|jgi:phenylacetic acid degradation operon negative regulatory protein|nr:PaaX family transcriptional regulator [Myxococcota bacterium]